MLPKDWFFKPERIEKFQTSHLNRIIDAAVVNPQAIADKIDEWANKDITKESQKANDIAEQFNWENQKEQLLSILQGLCGK